MNTLRIDIDEHVNAILILIEAQLLNLKTINTSCGLTTKEAEDYIFGEEDKAEQYYRDYEEEINECQKFDDALDFIELFDFRDAQHELLLTYKDFRESQESIINFCEKHGLMHELSDEIPVAMMAIDLTAAGKVFGAGEDVISDWAFGKDDIPKYVKIICDLHDKKIKRLGEL